MDNITALILATSILVMIPGPNVAIIVAKSIQQGFSAGFVATLGTTTGVAIQLLLTVFGITAIVELAASALVIVKWLGVAYLVWLGLRTWNTRNPNDSDGVLPSTSENFAHGFMVAILNPKTLLFNAAFLPQFISTGGSVTSQLFILSVVYLLVLLVGDLLWALAGSSVGPGLEKFGRISHRLTGGFLVGAGIGLALSRRSF